MGRVLQDEEVCTPLGTLVRNHLTCLEVLDHLAAAAHAGGGGASSAGGRLSKQASTQQRAIEKFMALPSRATEGGEGGGGGAGAGAGAGGDGSHIAHDGDAKFTKVAAELEGRIVNRAVA